MTTSEKAILPSGVRIFSPPPNGHSTALPTDGTTCQEKDGDITHHTFPVFNSLAMKELVQLVGKVAKSNLPVLITGETGTGKEVIADLVHSLSQRSEKRCVKINCAALPRDLIESELFGSVKGSFTGSLSDREGLFKQANGGTILLDEIAEMPIDTQAKLLRILQDKRCRPVGGLDYFTADCRVIASTNCSVEQAVKTGKLRDDLRYRLSGIVIHLPPLRERVDDIIPLAMHFLRLQNSQLLGFTQEAITRMLRYTWPGNVRQLESTVTCATLLADNVDLIDAQHLSIPDTTLDQMSEELSGHTLENQERRLIAATLRETGGNKQETARRLKIGRQTLYNKIKLYGISYSTDTGESECPRPKKSHSYPGPNLVKEAMGDAGNDLTQAAELLGISIEELRVKLLEYGIGVGDSAQAVG
jgi:DNA-binding NtrC family response regulator